MGQPHVVYGVDNRYLAPLLVSMYSVLKTASRDVRVTVLTTDPPIAPDAPAVRRLNDCFPDAEVHVRYFDSANLREFEESNAMRWPAVVMTPLLVPWLIDDRCIFLDADTLVLHDIAEVFRTDLDGLPIGACHATSTAINVRKCRSVGLHGLMTPRRHRKRTREIMEWKDRLGFTIEELETEYFSPGVVLYDTPMIRNLDPDRKLADIELNRKHWNSQPDSDPINVLFKGRIHRLDLKWNVYRDFLPWNRRFCTPELWSAVERATADPAVLHYPGICRRRPWRRPWYARRRRYRVYEEICRELENRTGIDIRRLLDQGPTLKGRRSFEPPGCRGDAVRQKLESE